MTTEQITAILTDCKDTFPDHGFVIITAKYDEEKERTEFKYASNLPTDKDLCDALKTVELFLSATKN
jgi:hypothetical protein